VAAFGAVLARASFLAAPDAIESGCTPIPLAADCGCRRACRRGHRALLEVVRPVQLTDTIVLHAGSAAAAKHLGERLAAASQMTALGGRATGSMSARTFPFRHPCWSRGNWRHCSKNSPPQPQAFLCDDLKGRRLLLHKLDRHPNRQARLKRFPKGGSAPTGCPSLSGPRLQR
jgi:hypothetical protein